MTPKRPRKPATILRELESEVDWLIKFNRPAPSTLAGVRLLLAELGDSLSRAIATSGKAPGR